MPVIIAVIWAAVHTVVVSSRWLSQAMTGGMPMRSTTLNAVNIHCKRRSCSSRRTYQSMLSWTSITYSRSSSFSVADVLAMPRRSVNALSA